MMNWGYNMMNNVGFYGWWGVVLSLITWILLIVALVVFIRWMWKKGGK